jgi:hypothetical protein
MLRTGKRTGDYSPVSSETAVKQLREAKIDG